MYKLRVWKYLGNNNKQLENIIENDDLKFMELIYKEFKKMYYYYNYEIEKVGF